MPGFGLFSHNVHQQCRLPQSVPRELKKQYAKSLLSVLDLEKQAHMVIGNNAQDGISADQRKRVTIGVEMAADPAILFLDEVGSLMLSRKLDFLPLPSCSRHLG